MSNWYKKAISEKDLGFKREFHDLVINIEHPAGTERIGVNDKGKEWRTKMKYDYGFIYAAKGADGEGIDVYLGPDEKAKQVYIVHQNKPDTGKYDEDKVMLGFQGQKDAKKAYLDHYDSSDFFGGMTVVSFSEFKKTIEEENGKKIKWKKKK